MAARRQQYGIVLADLLVGLMVGAIVLAAAATMADAMSCGKRATEQISRTSNYLAQVQTRLADAVMRAESVAPRSGGGVVLGYAEGQTTDVYVDGSQRICFAESGGTLSYLADPLQTAADVSAADANRVVITLEMSEHAGTQQYVMTATRRGGE